MEPATTLVEPVLLAATSARTLTVTLALVLVPLNVVPRVWATKLMLAVLEITVPLGTPALTCTRNLFVALAFGASVPP